MSRSMARLRIMQKWTPYRYGERERSASARAQGKHAKATDRHTSSASTSLFLVNFPVWSSLSPKSLNPHDNAGLILCHKYLVIRRFSQANKLMVACSPRAHPHPSPSGINTLPCTHITTPHHGLRKLAGGLNKATSFITRTADHR
jgi:hypothetical protein